MLVNFLAIKICCLVPHMASKFEVTTVQSHKMRIKMKKKRLREVCTVHLFCSGMVEQKERLNTQLHYILKEETANLSLISPALLCGTPPPPWTGTSYLINQHFLVMWFYLQNFLLFSYNFLTQLPFSWAYE